jgi:predicted HTH domain antitoxin
LWKNDFSSRSEIGIMPVVISVADHIVQAARLSRAEVIRELSLMLYAQEKITLGAAAEVAEMPQFEFQLFAGGRGIPPHYDHTDLEDDVQTLRKRGVM